MEVLTAEETYEGKIERFKKLKELDEQFCNKEYSLLKSLILSGKRSICKKFTNTPKKISLAGSTFEGSTVARIFTPNNDFKDGLNREVELDLELILLEILPEFKYCVKDIPGKIGYVNVCASPEILMFTNDVELNASKKYVEELLTKRSEEGYFHPYNVKNFALEKLKLRDKRKLVEIAFAAVCDEKISDISVLKTEKITNASVGSEYTIQVKNKNTIKLSIDFVTLIRIPWWPDVASEWKERKRNWPVDQRTIDDLTQTCHIIAKPSATEKDDEETLDWRYSFSDVERKLFSMYNAQQKLIYFIYKSMFYKWLKPTCPTQLSSFIGKNIMLKAGEDFPPQDEMWNESYESIKTALAYLFVQMQMAFESNCLPYYFMSKINVIENIDQKVKKEVIEKIKWMISNIEERIPSNVNDVVVFVEDVIQKLNSFDGIISNVREKDYSDFLNVKFFVSNIDFLDKIALIWLKDVIEKRNVEERISKEFARIKSTVHSEALSVKNVVSKKKRFTDKLAVLVANVNPAIQIVTFNKVKVEAKAINEVKRVIDEVDKNFPRVVKKLFRF